MGRHLQVHHWNECNRFAFTTDKIGERQAKRFVERLYSFGVVGEAIEKLPRKVLFTCIEDLPDEVIGFLNRYANIEYNYIFYKYKRETAY